MKHNLKALIIFHLVSVKLLCTAGLLTVDSNVSACVNLADAI